MGGREDAGRLRPPKEPVGPPPPSSPRLMTGELSWLLAVLATGAACAHVFVTLSTLVARGCRTRRRLSVFPSFPWCAGLATLRSLTPFQRRAVRWLTHYTVSKAPHWS